MTLNVQLSTSFVCCAALQVCPHKILRVQLGTVYVLAQSMQHAIY